MWSLQKGDDNQWFSSPLVSATPHHPSLGTLPRPFTLSFRRFASAYNTQKKELALRPTALCQLFYLIPAFATRLANIRSIDRTPPPLHLRLKKIFIFLCLWGLSTVQLDALLQLFTFFCGTGYIYTLLTLLAHFGKPQCYNRRRSQHQNKWHVLNVYYIYYLCHCIK